MKKLVLYGVMMLLTACTVRPRSVLTQREMAAVLTDLHRAEGTLQVKGRMAASYDEENALYYEAILAKHDLTQAQFDSSLVWYTAHPKQFQRVYPKVIRQLQKEKDVLDEMKVDKSKAYNFKHKRRTPPYNIDSLYNRFHEALDTLPLKVATPMADISAIPLKAD